MRNLLALLGAALVTFAVVGWYRGWYEVKTEPDAAGHREVNIDINAPKIKKDLNQGRAKLKEVLDPKDKVKGASAQVPPQIPDQGQPPAAVPTGFAPTFPTPEGEEYVLPPGTGVPPTPAPRVYHD